VAVARVVERKTSGGRGYHESLFSGWEWRDELEVCRQQEMSGFDDRSFLKVARMDDILEMKRTTEMRERTHGILEGTYSNAVRRSSKLSIPSQE
jgi:hypothetical protein